MSVNNKTIKEQIDQILKENNFYDFFFSTRNEIDIRKQHENKSIIIGSFDLEGIEYKDNQKPILIINVVELENENDFLINLFYKSPDLNIDFSKRYNGVLYQTNNNCEKLINEVFTELKPLLKFDKFDVHIYMDDDHIECGDGCCSSYSSGFKIILNGKEYKELNAEADLYNYCQKQRIDWLIFYIICLIGGFYDFKIKYYE